MLLEVCGLLSLGPGPHHFTSHMKLPVFPGPLEVEEWKRCQQIHELKRPMRSTQALLSSLHCDLSIAARAVGRTLASPSIQSVFSSRISHPTSVPATRLDCSVQVLLVAHTSMLQNGLQGRSPSPDFTS